nr:hypothetical protein [uncultured Pseudomonas sp.]
MTASLEGVAAMLPAGGGGAGLEASRNLFEYMASKTGASPAQIGDGLMERLNGFIDRQRSFAEHANVQSHAAQSANWPEPDGSLHASALQPSTATSEPTSNGAGQQKVGDGQIDHIVVSLGRMFDYSIETQMVVRSATQVSGATNTLLKGQ